MGRVIHAAPMAVILPALMAGILPHAAWKAFTKFWAFSMVTS